jgi:hypothetical protein
LSSSRICWRAIAAVCIIALSAALGARVALAPTHQGFAIAAPVVALTVIYCCCVLWLSAGRCVCPWLLWWTGAAFATLRPGVSPAALLAIGPVWSRAAISAFETA